MKDKIHAASGPARRQNYEIMNKHIIPNGYCSITALNASFCAVKTMNAALFVVTWETVSPQPFNHTEMARLTFVFLLARQIKDERK